MKKQPKHKYLGTFLAINGKFIRTDELQDYCYKCFSLLRYNEEFDTNFCARCNEWRDLARNDINSEKDCRQRPQKPFDE
ncbi:hypothetical protein [Rummeliibacillus pycnus]|uniref:hypothetical protein n=1 Tax=Rummeliibacillus pycnus TaxID=101070 RepID=UPI0037C710A8